MIFLYIHLGNDLDENMACESSRGHPLRSWDLRSSSGIGSTDPYPVYTEYQPDRTDPRRSGKADWMERSRLVERTGRNDSVDLTYSSTFRFYGVVSLQRDVGQRTLNVHS